MKRTLRIVGHFISAVVAVLAILAAATIFQGQATVARADLGVDGFDEMRCPRGYDKFYDHGMISEQVAEDHFIYGLASLTAYHYSKDQQFNMINFTDSGFVRFETKAVSPNDSLYFDAYIRRKDPGKNIYEVIVAFRGTRFSHLADWFSNFSWFTGIIPVENHYGMARRAFSKLRAELRQTYPDGDCTFVATGHSLGGGLAQHIAAAFPCVSSVVFDTSFVTNNYILKTPFRQTKTASIYEKGDELTGLRHLVMGHQVDTLAYRWYPINLNLCNPKAKTDGKKDLCKLGKFTRKFFCTNLQHGLREHVVGMARLVGDCQVNGTGNDGCGPNVSKSTALIDLYCRTHGDEYGAHRDADVCLASWDRQRQTR
jgi:hypothetical protein